MKNKGELIKIGISALITILLIGLTVIKPSQSAGGFDVSACISMSEEEVEDFISEQNLERNELFDEMMEGEPDSGYVSYQNEELSLMLNDAGTIELINILNGTTYDFAGVKLGDDYLDGNTTVGKLQEAGYALDEYLETTAFWMRDGGNWLLRLDMDENDIITEISLYRAEETEYGSSEMAEPEDAGSEISEPEDALPSDADMENVETSAAIAETEALEDEYVIPGSDSRYLTDADVEGLDLDQIRFAINEIYARHGRAFQTEDLNEYFSSKSWYTPLYSADEFAAIEDSVMNDYEKENIKFLAAIRDSANGSASSQFEAGWIYGTYEIHDGGIDAVAEIGWYSDTGEDYISLSGATSDGSSLAEFTGTVVSSKGNSYTAVDENGDVIDFTYNGVDAIEITNGYVSDGGLYFPGFEGTYQKTADLSHNVS